MLFVTLVLALYGPYVEIEKTYNITKNSSEFKNLQAVYMWKNSMLRRLLLRNSQAKRLNGTQALQKRQTLAQVGQGGLAARSAIAISAPALVGLVQAFSIPGLDAGQRSDMIFTSAFDLATNALFLAGGPIGTAVGSALMIAKIIFNAFDPPKLPLPVDGDLLFKKMIDYVQMAMPTHDQMFMEMKNDLNDLFDDKFETRMQIVYQQQLQQSFKSIAESLNSIDISSSNTEILSNFNALIVKIKDQMSVNKLPLDGSSDYSQFQNYELTMAAAIYPTFSSMLLLAFKEYYLVARLLGMKTEDIETRYNHYVLLFQEQQLNLVEHWYKDSINFIDQSRYEKTDSGTCLMTLKYPNAKNTQGYVIEKTAERKYSFINETADTVPKYNSSSCRDASCQFIRILDANATKVCTFNKTYTPICKKPCSKAKQAFSWILPILGAMSHKCFMNKEECQYKQNGLSEIGTNCTMSQCESVLRTSKSKFKKQLKTQYLKLKNTALKYKAYLQDAKIADEKSIKSILIKRDTYILKRFIPSNEIFRGNTCQGILLKHDTTDDLICAFKEKIQGGCLKTLDGQAFYVLSQKQTCLEYTKPLVEKALHRRITDDQFNTLHKINQFS